MIDLHVHTLHSSDGQYSPSEILSMASGLGVETLAFCDHMDIRAVAEGQDTARGIGVELLSGVELSTSWLSRERHLLCYGFDPADPRIREFISRACAKIWEAVSEVVAEFRRMGFDLERRDLSGWGRSVPTGVTFLDALLTRNPGDERLQRYVNGDRSGSPYLNFYQDFSRAGLEEAIARTLPDLVETMDEIRGCGVLVLAHPGEIGEAALEELKRCGLAGIEVYSTHHSPEVTRRLAAAASSLGLFASAGSDFHGERIKPGITLGGVPGPPDRALVDAIRACMSSWYRAGG